MDPTLTILEDLPLLVRVVVTTGLCYVYLVMLIRLTGKRSVAHMNSFDWIVNVAVGSLTANAILDPANTLEAWIAVATIILLQLLLTRAVVRVPLLSRLVREEPRLVLRDGEMLTDAMRDARVNPEEVLAALRAAGVRDRAQVAAVVFEADGRLSVIRAGTEAAPETDVLNNLRHEYTGLPDG